MMRTIIVSTWVVMNVIQGKRVPDMVLTWINKSPVVGTNIKKE